MEITRKNENSLEIKISQEELFEKGLSGSFTIKDIMEVLLHDSKINEALHYLNIDNNLDDLPIIPLHFQLLDTKDTDSYCIKISIPDLSSMLYSDDDDDNYDFFTDNWECCSLSLLEFKSIDSLLQYAKVATQSAKVYKHDECFYVITESEGSAECEFADNINIIDFSRVAHVEEMWEYFTELETLKNF